MSEEEYIIVKLTICLYMNVKELREWEVIYCGFRNWHSSEWNCTSEVASSVPLCLCSSVNFTQKFCYALTVFSSRDQFMLITYVKLCGLTERSSCGPMNSPTYDPQTSLALAMAVEVTRDPGSLRVLASLPPLPPPPPFCISIISSADKLVVCRNCQQFLPS